MYLDVKDGNSYFLFENQKTDPNQDQAGFMLMRLIYTFAWSWRGLTCNKTCYKNLFINPVFSFRALYLETKTQYF